MAVTVSPAAVRLRSKLAFKSQASQGKASGKWRPTAELYATGGLPRLATACFRSPPVDCTEFIRRSGLFPPRLRLPFCFVFKCFILSFILQIGTLDKSLEDLLIRVDEFVGMLDMVGNAP